MIINASTFFSYLPREQGAIVAHELGHGICHRTGDPDWQSDLEADLMACRLGYCDEIRAERQAKHPLYAEGLAYWRNIDDARKAAQWGLNRDKFRNLLG